MTQILAMAEKADQLEQLLDRLRHVDNPDVQAALQSAHLGPSTPPLESSDLQASPDRKEEANSDPLGLSLDTTPDVHRP